MPVRFLVSVKLVSLILVQCHNTVLQEKVHVDRNVLVLTKTKLSCFQVQLFINRNGCTMVSYVLLATRRLSLWRTSTVLCWRSVKSGRQKTRSPDGLFLLAK